MDNDHDLLVRIDEQVKQLRTGFDAERMMATVRATKQDADLQVVKDEVDDLRVSRAQMYAIAATISVCASIVIKLLWH